VLLAYDAAGKRLTRTRALLKVRRFWCPPPLPYRCFAVLPVPREFAPQWALLARAPEANTAMPAKLWYVSVFLSVWTAWRQQRKDRLNAVRESARESLKQAVSGARTEQPTTRSESGVQRDQVSIIWALLASHARVPL
jgi:hypothetical protein